MKKLTWIASFALAVTVFIFSCSKEKPDSSLPNKPIITTFSSKGVVSVDYVKNLADSVYGYNLSDEETNIIIALTSDSSYVDYANNRINETVNIVKNLDQLQIILQDESVSEAELLPYCNLLGYNDSSALTNRLLTDSAEINHLIKRFDFTNLDNKISDVALTVLLQGNNISFVPPSNIGIISCVSICNSAFNVQCAKLVAESLVAEAGCIGLDASGVATWAGILCHVAVHGMLTTGIASAAIAK